MSQYPQEVPLTDSSPKGVGKDGYPPSPGYPPFHRYAQPPVPPPPVVAYVVEPSPPSCLDVCLATLCCCCFLDLCFPWPYAFPYF